MNNEVKKHSITDKEKFKRAILGEKTANIAQSKIEESKSIKDVYGYNKNSTTKNSTSKN